MKESLKKFYEYDESDEELYIYIRINVEWNEDSFCRMKKLVKAMMEEYANDESYPQALVSYFLLNIPLVIDSINRLIDAPEECLPLGYTQKTYRSMLTDRIKQLEKLREEFIDSCSYSEDFI